MRGVSAGGAPGGVAVTETLTIAQLRDRWTESQFQTHVLNLARSLGWLVYHSWTSVHSAKGFPDLVMVRGERMVCAELKSAKGKVSPEQEAWLAAMGRVTGVEAYIWRPADWDRVEEVLM